MLMQQVLGKTRTGGMLLAADWLTRSMQPDSDKRHIAYS